MSHNDDIFDELDDAPILKSLKGKEQFEPPEGYFQHLSIALQDKLEDEAIFQEAPRLRSVEKENIWLVPKRYFEEFPARLMQRIDGQAKVIPLWEALRPKLIWAAAAVVLVFAIWLGVRPSNVDQGAQLASIDDIPNEELVEALETAGIDSYDLMVAISEDDELVAQFASQTREILVEEIEEGAIWDELELDDLEEIMMDL